MKRIFDIPHGRIIEIDGDKKVSIYTHTEFFRRFLRMKLEKERNRYRAGSNAKNQ